ncbi:MAG: hypothetical protein ABI812_10875, partial [Betaproteobacteria bacterium]
DGSQAATEGFTIVLCDLKCLLETGQSGNMVRDKAALISAASARPATLTPAASLYNQSTVPIGGPRAKAHHEPR